MLVLPYGIWTVVFGLAALGACGYQGLIDRRAAQKREAARLDST